ncbi:pancreatic lipase-related protein 2-like [Mixophyes fleayi]|uniref:pancreatic lipase-related protein 2-like n=1 Tax=Mixophyes fleayi TaxID=3061075 RepID=UPI003F4DE4D9
MGSATEEMIVALLLVISLTAAVNGNVCYERLGCFSDEAPYANTLQRPIGRTPWTPEKINTQFLLFTRENPSNYQKISAINPATISSSNFKSSRKSRFIIHGLIEKGEKYWLVDMCKAMLEVEDVNCLCVDWSGGAYAFYTQAANNVRVVGAEVAYFINTLLDQFDYSLSRIHVIGHSLGAHAAGEAGKRRPGISRITGLDPAKLYFQDTPAEVRLDISDATLVDVIHTDGSSLIGHLGFTGFGMSQLVGHLDFFPNGGEQMPGCGKPQFLTLEGLDNLVEGVLETVFCNHHRSFKYYTDSIANPGGLIGYPSTSYRSFQEGTGFPCPSAGCPLMGHYADEYNGVTPTTQTFYLNTGDVQPYSRWRYKLTVHTNGSRNVLGSMKLSLNGANGNSNSYEISRGIIKTDTSYTKYIDSEIDLGYLRTVTFIWQSSNILNSKLRASAATVQNGKNGITYSFCSRGEDTLDVTQTLYPCVSKSLV